jgi:DNA repair protein RecO (recombination protein O)
VAPKGPSPLTDRPTPAIVLTLREYGEADLLVTFLAPGGGRLTGIAKHARKSRRRFVHCLEPLSRVNFFLAPSRGELEFIQKGELVQAFPSLRRDLKRLAVAALLAEVAGLLAGPPEARSEIFATLEEALGLLEAGVPPESLLPLFLLRLLGSGGYRPRLSPCLQCGREPAGSPLFFHIPRGGVLCAACRQGVPGASLPLSPGAWKLLRLAQDLPRDKLSRLRFPASQREQSLAVFRALLAHHVGQDLKSWPFWEKVISRR